MIFIFGSNTQGRHGKGAAKYAVENHGAVYGVPMGRQGNSYAIITKELRSDKPPVKFHDVEVQIQMLRVYAKDLFPNEQFQLTKIGCGLAGFGEDDIREMCEAWLGDLPNIQFPEDWR